MPDFDTSHLVRAGGAGGHAARDRRQARASAVAEATKSPEVVAAWKPQGIDPLEGGPDEFASYIGGEIKRWGEVAEAAGLKK